MAPDPPIVDRFRDDLDALAEPGQGLGIAVSGGADSLALLLLAAAARPGRIEAATVDHALREGSRAEAEMVAGLCATLGVRHEILRVAWEADPERQVQAAARNRRYRLLEKWAESRNLGKLATAHHLDDQAETVLMRLNRGAGVSGLSGVRESRPLTATTDVIRPLLRWRRAELVEICRTAHLRPVDDPSNDDARFERSKVRRLLAGSDWFDVAQIARSADHLHDADEALEWAAARLIEDRMRRDGDDILVDGRNLPIELQRRLLIAAHEIAGNMPLRGPDLGRAILSLRAGRTATLGSVKMIGDPVWRLQIAPPRTPSKRG